MKFDFSSKEQFDNTVEAYEESIKEKEKQADSYPALLETLQAERSALNVRLGQLKQWGRKWRKTLK